MRVSRVDRARKFVLAKAYQPDEVWSTLGLHQGPRQVEVYCRRQFVGNIVPEGDRFLVLLPEDAATSRDSKIALLHACLDDRGWGSILEAVQAIRDVLVGGDLTEDSTGTAGMNHRLETADTRREKFGVPKDPETYKTYLEALDKYLRGSRRLHWFSGFVWSLAKKTPPSRILSPAQEQKLIELNELLNLKWPFFQDSLTENFHHFQEVKGPFLRWHIAGQPPLALAEETAMAYDKAERESRSGVYPYEQDPYGLNVFGYSYP